MPATKAWKCHWRFLKVIGKTTWSVNAVRRWSVTQQKVIRWFDRSSVLSFFFLSFCFPYPFLLISFPPYSFVLLKKTQFLRFWWLQEKQADLFPFKREVVGNDFMRGARSMAKRLRTSKSDRCIIIIIIQKSFFLISNWERWVFNDGRNISQVHSWHGAIKEMARRVGKGKRRRIIIYIKTPFAWAPIWYVYSAMAR